MLPILISICVAGSSPVANYHSRLLLQSRSDELNAIVAGMEADRIQHDLNTAESNRRGEQLKSDRKQRPPTLGFRAGGFFVSGRSKKMAEIIKKIQKDNESKKPVDPPK